MIPYKESIYVVLLHISTGWTPRLSAYRSLTVNGRRRKTSARLSFSSRRTFLMLKVGMPGLPCLSTVKMVTGLTSFLFCSVFKKWLTPSAASDNTRCVLSFTCGSCPVEGRSHHANVIRQFYIRRTLPLTLQGCLIRRRSAADVWSIRRCLYARYIHRTQVRLPYIFAGNVALLTGQRLINRAYRKGAAPPASPIHS